MPRELTEHHGLGASQLVPSTGVDPLDIFADSGHVVQVSSQVTLISGITDIGYQPRIIPLDGGYFVLAASKDTSPTGYRLVLCHHDGSTITVLDTETYLPYSHTISSGHRLGEHHSAWKVDATRIVILSNGARGVDNRREWYSLIVRRSGDTLELGSTSTWAEEDDEGLIDPSGSEWLPQSTWCACLTDPSTLVVFFGVDSVGVSFVHSMLARVLTISGLALSPATDWFEIFSENTGSFDAYRPTFCHHVGGGQILVLEQWDGDDVNPGYWSLWQLSGTSLDLLQRVEAPHDSTYDGYVAKRSSSSVAVALRAGGQSRRYLVEVVDDEIVFGPMSSVANDLDTNFSQYSMPQATVAGDLVTWDGQVADWTYDGTPAQAKLLTPTTTGTIGNPSMEAIGGAYLVGWWSNNIETIATGILGVLFRHGTANPLPLTDLSAGSQGHREVFDP